MHIVLVSPGWPRGRHPNGIVTYVHWMRQELLARGHRVTVLTPHLDEPANDVVEVETSVPWRARRWLARRLGRRGDAVFAWGDALADQIARLHHRIPVDVIEMEESFGWVRAVSRRLNVPAVVKLHGPAFLTLLEQEHATPLASMKILQEGRGLREVRFVMSPSRGTLDATLNRYGLSPDVGRLVVNPIELPANAPIWRLDACDPETLLFVGRFDRLKGGDLVLQAFASLHRERPSLRLVFVGPDPGLTGGSRTLHLADALAQTLSPEAAARVEYLGAIPFSDIYAIRVRAFMTIVASRWETQSYTALEAMLQGCPVVSSNVGGPAELITEGRNGLLFEAGDANDLAAKIRILLDDVDYAARLGAEARRHVESRHDPDAVVDRTLDVYREAIESSRSRG